MQEQDCKQALLPLHFLYVCQNMHSNQRGVATFLSPAAECSNQTTYTSAEKGNKPFQVRLSDMTIVYTLSQSVAKNDRSNVWKQCIYSIDLKRTIHPCVLLLFNGFTRSKGIILLTKSQDYLTPEEFILPSNVADHSSSNISAVSHAKLLINLPFIQTMDAM